jgi:hypothetical protein
MGLIRKTMSVSTLGMIDYRSDKERMARSARLTKEATRKGNRQQKKLLEAQNAMIAQQMAAQQQIMAMQAAQFAPASPPGWYDDGNHQMRWWDGRQWGAVAPAPAVAAPAGWYPDPEVPGQSRYWDGAQWTEHRQNV